MADFIFSLRSSAKHAFERIRNERLRQTLLQALPFWTASLITGVFAVGYARAFALAEKWSSLIFHYHAWLLFIISPVCFILSWWLVRQFAPYSRGSGIPQVMAALELATPTGEKKINKLLSFRIIIIKVLSSMVMAVGGGAVGREGPTIQIAGSIFTKMNDVLPKWWPRISKKNMIMTGAAAGLAAAFNTPLGGIVFAVEELSKTHINHFKSAIFAAVIIAGLTAQSMAGSYLYIGYPVIKDTSNYILIGVVAVAIIAGLMGAIMSKIILLIFRWKRGFTKNYQHIAYLLVCSLTLATLAYFINASAMGSGKDLITRTLFTNQKYLHWYMPLLRTVGPILSFTSGASGGVFAPGLSAGATIGSVISKWCELSPSNTNLMVLAGMVAFLTGITRAPFTSAILVLEMTDKHTLILHLMLAGIVASIFAILIDKHSFYDYLKEQYLEDLRREETAV